MRTLLSRIRSLFRSRQLDADLDEELRAHIDLAIAENLMQGMTMEKARTAALRTFGGITQIREAYRVQRGLPWIQTVPRNIQVAIRLLRRSPGFAITAILTLAFGIGATTAIFSIVDAVLLRPLPFPDSDRLVTLGDQLGGTWTADKHQPGIVTAPEVVTYQRDTRSFESLGGYTLASYALSGVGQPDQILAGRMTPSVFSSLGVGPLMGRLFTSEEDHRKAPVAVLSYATWKNRFNGSLGVIGTTIDLDRKPYTVIGVMPRNFEFPLWAGLNRSELWVPMSFTAQELSPQAPAKWNMLMIGRLKPGITAAQAQDDAQRVAAQIMRSYPPSMSNIHIMSVVNTLDAITVDYARPLLCTLFWAVVVVLLIACVNFAGLLLVRAIGRQREAVLRMVLGSSAKLLLWQAMTESLALSMAGGLVGIGLAAFAIYAGRNLLANDLPPTTRIVLNGTVAGFGLLLALVTGGLCGLVPGFAALGANANASLKEGAQGGSAGGSHARIRSLLVVAEIAIALVLLCASGLFLRSYMNVSNVNLGFEPGHVTTAAYALPPREYSTQSQVDSFNGEVVLRLSRLPGVESVGLADSLPTTGGGFEHFVADGYVDPHGPGQTFAASTKVMGDFFRVMGIPLIRGRYFTDADNADGQLAVIVNHKFAERFWPHQSPIGKRMRLGALESTNPWITVVGEVADVKDKRPEADTTEQFYLPVAQLAKDNGAAPTPNGTGGYIVLRSALPPGQMENGLRAVVRTIDSDLPLREIQTMDQVVSQREAVRRFSTAVVSSFALAAVLLAGLGIYSIVAFSVASRAKEIAIRFALGSSRGEILRLVLSSGTKMAVVGVLIGLVGTAAASSLVRSFLFKTSPFDPTVLALAAIAIFALTLAASAIPARRAATVDPIQALREQ